MVSKVKEKTWFSKHPVLGTIAIIFGVLLITGGLNNLFNSNNSNTEANNNSQSIYKQNTENPQAKCTPNWDCGSWSECSKSGSQTRTCTDSNNCGTNSGKPKTSQSCTYEYGLGDKVIVDGLAYTIHSKTEKNKIGESNEYVGFMGEEADGVFYIFDITIENVGKESETFSGSNIKIYDNQGRTFDHDTTAEIYLDDSFQYDQLQPGLPKRGKIVFDVPKGLSGKLEISSTKLISDKKEYVSWE